MALASTRGAAAALRRPLARRALSSAASPAQQAAAPTTASPTTTAPTPTPHRFPRRRLPFVPTTFPTPSAEDAVNNILYNSPPATCAPHARHILNCLVSNEPGVLSRVSGILAGRGFNIDSLVVAKTEVPDLSRMTIVLCGQDIQVEQARRQLEDLVPVWAVIDYSLAKLVEREILLVKVSTVPVGPHLDHHASSGDWELESGALDASLASSSSSTIARSASQTHTSTAAAGRADPPVSPSGPSSFYSAMPPVLASSMQRQAITDIARVFGGKIVDVNLDSVIVELSAKPSRIDAFVELLKPYGILEASRSGAMSIPRTQIEGLTDDKQSALDHCESASSVDATMLPPG